MFLRAGEKALNELLETLETGWGLAVVLWFQSWRTELIFDAAFALSVGVVYFFAAWLNQWFKEWWQRPRPFQVSSEVDWPYESDSFGLPSGHATLTVTAWGLIAMWVRRWWARVAIICYIVLTVLTRLVLGVHYPQDVIVGSLIGLAILGLYSRLEPRLGAWIPKQSTGRLIGIIVGLGAVMVLIHPTLFPCRPGTWADSTGVVGIFIGLAAGFVLETRLVGFSAGGSWWRRILRYLVGTAVLIGLIAVSTAIGGAGLPAPVFSLLMSAVTALWVSFGAPWVFVRFGLAEVGEARVAGGGKHHEES
jgi:membrane-associated phospholipid phosphatase